jgi:hypothetical protein
MTGAKNERAKEEFYERLLTQACTYAGHEAGRVPNAVGMPQPQRHLVDTLASGWREMPEIGLSRRQGEGEGHLERRYERVCMRPDDGDAELLPGKHVARAVGACSQQRHPRGRRDVSHA